MIDLEKLVSPVSAGEFKRNYWEKKPLNVRRMQRDYYGSLFTLDTVDQLLSTSSVPIGQIRVVNDGVISPIDVRDHNDATLIESVYAEYRKGATINLKSIEGRCEELRELCYSLSQEFATRFRAGSYLTPASAKGLGLHHDTHSVFVLQTEGTKRWEVYDPAISMPLPGQYLNTKVDEVGELVEEFELRAGDLAYIPRGFPHRAFSDNSPSLHLTIGAHVVTWTSVILGAIYPLLTQDPKYREALPVSLYEDLEGQDRAAKTLRDLLDTMMNSIEPSSVIADAVDRIMLATTPNLAGHLSDLRELPNVNMACSLRVRPSTNYQVDSDDDWIHIKFHGKSIQLPVDIASEVLFILRANEFTPKEIPGHMDDIGKMTLVRNLLREGLLTFL